jgi:hypothetical protein
VRHLKNKEIGKEIKKMVESAESLYKNDSDFPNTPNFSGFKPSTYFNNEYSNTDKTFILSKNSIHNNTLDKINEVYTNYLIETKKNIIELELHGVSLTRNEFILELIKSKWFLDIWFK